MSSWPFFCHNFGTFWEAVRESHGLHLLQFREVLGGQQQRRGRKSLFSGNHGFVETKPSLWKPDHHGTGSELMELTVEGRMKPGGACDAIPASGKRV